MTGVSFASVGESEAGQGLGKCARLKLAVSGFVDEQTFDRVADPAKMVKPYAVVAA